MNINVKKISELDFRNLKIPTLFEDEPIDRAFGIVSNGRAEYKIGWQSEDIKPVVKCINVLLCSIGIDLVFVIFDFSTGEVLKKVYLDYYFYDIIIHKELLFVITQLEVIRIITTDFSLNKTYSLPDYIENFKIEKGILVIKCIGGDIVYVQ
ncbi:hypothetical protein [Arsenicibacter rosenii]|uniref:Uncharacterized protein n=1 Tax=Arsenicibacter rosenii TaxID=1750698 RepID=A0A1S2VDA2_9BACT|nr:hypothetical protein [Arsenicibacter rosenii]OIN56672.1 hypothetical protein BLX24_23895 [Arsenicibacter rosenii]